MMRFLISSAELLCSSPLSYSLFLTHASPRECSVFAITDGEAILILEPVVDHKQVGEGDTGPNTGGMGVYSPAPSLGNRVLRQIEQRVVIPSIHAVRREGIDFRGVLFIGLMLTESGPKVLEYNVRFGDPEAQALVRPITPGYIVQAKVFEKALADIANGADVADTLDAAADEVNEDIENNSGYGH